jgi:hypothetical protein
LPFGVSVVLISMSSLKISLARASCWSGLGGERAAGKARESLRR